MLYFVLKTKDWKQMAMVCRLSLPYKCEINEEKLSKTFKWLIMEKCLCQQAKDSLDDTYAHPIMNHEGRDEVGSKQLRDMM